MAHVYQVGQTQSPRLERYELLAELAAGGMATVYLARLGGAGGFQRLYAIKRLHPHLAQQQEFVEMFLDEARLAARIHHPNVVPILEVGTSEAGYYLVMEYIEGETLARLLGRTATHGERIPSRVSAKIVLDTLSGLETAHGLSDDYGQPLNLVHRDVSPQNIMVGVDGTSRITDFGVARAATRLTTTRAGQLKGKLGYMAPEQAQADDIDKRADVFAVGVILWECLAGRRLFRSKNDANDAQTLNRLLYEPIPTLRETDASIPAEFDAVCQRALERQSTDRFGNCAEFAEALEQAALHAGGLASTREVASFVDSVAGPELAAQRDAVRSWMASSRVSRIDRAELEGSPDVASSTGPLALTQRHGKPAAEGVDVEVDVEMPRRLPIGWLVAGGLLLLIAGAFALVFLLRPPAPEAYVPSTHSVPLPVITQPGSTASATSSAPPSTLSAPPSTSAPPSASAPVAVPPWPTHRPTYGGKRPKGEKGPGKGSDDLNTNPYR